METLNGDFAVQGEVQEKASRAIICAERGSFVAFNLSI